MSEAGASPADRRFEAIVFDWDGTAVADRSADAGPVRRLVEELCAAGVHAAVVSGTHVGNVDDQLRARPAGGGSLHLLLDRGLSVYRVDPGGPHLVDRRAVTAEEDHALDVAADLAASAFATRGLAVGIVRRHGRRKIDLIPEPAWADPPKSRIADLLGAVEARLRAAGIGSLAEAVVIASAAAADAGLGAARITSDAKHIEVGLTDKADSARWFVAELWRRGVGAGQLLVIGDEMGQLGGVTGSDAFLLVPELARATVVSVGVEPEGVPAGIRHVDGGPAAFRDILACQLRRRGDPPTIDGHPDWTIEVRGIDEEVERANEALLTLSDGRIATAGSPSVAHRATSPRVLANGLFHGAGAESSLLPLPLWARAPLDPLVERELTRRLDLRTGTLEEHALGPTGEWRSLRFVSLRRPGIAVVRATASAPLLPVPVLAVVGDALETERGERDGVEWMRLTSGEAGAAVAVRERRRVAGRAVGLERIAAYRIDSRASPRPDAALADLAAAEESGFERLLGEQREAWASRWGDADVRMEGDADLAKAVRFALFHLMAAAVGHDEAAVGARGATGTAYRGHVLWDAEMYVLPFLVATYPAAARAMLEYRIRRLPMARENARASGRSGARFPWESASTGEDVTPRLAHDPSGRLIHIRTGELEEHITADIAWAAALYSDWTGDGEFARGPGRALITETARYWASRAEIDGSGRAHIKNVIGPDEYHEGVDDNVYTNVMARWNLRRAAHDVLADATADDRAEAEHWRAVADALVDGYDASTGLYEQFDGFFALEPLLIRDVAPRRPIAADVLLGPDRVHAAQIVKQADVLMLHHVVPDEVVAGSLVPNLRFYEPRTAHGSSLSPGIHAALLARAGELDAAVELLRLTSRIDLDDVTGTTAGGLHLAAMGTVWQALVLGCIGARPRGDLMCVDPRLPRAWGSLEAGIRFRGARMRLRVTPDAVNVCSDIETRMRIGGVDVAVGPSGTIVPFDASGDPR